MAQATETLKVAKWLVDAHQAALMHRGHRCQRTWQAGSQACTTAKQSLTWARSQQVHHSALAVEGLLAHQLHVRPGIAQQQLSARHGGKDGQHICEGVEGQPKHLANPGALVAGKHLQASALNMRV